MDSNGLSSAISHFSFKFCRELTQNKNVVSSPLSAETLLALLTLGTSGPAHSELLNSLGFADDASIRASFAEVTSKLNSLQGVTLNIANKVYIQDGPYELQPQLKADAVNVFDADIEKVDFNSAPTVLTINQWVENKTENKINNLLSKDTVDSDTRLVLINALYFKGTWKQTFDSSNTTDQTFHINANTTVKIPMMYRQDNYAAGYSQELQAKILELDYVGKTASMLIVAPKEIEGLNDVIAKLADGYDLTSDFHNMENTLVGVSIPKFKIESEIDLKNILPKLGVKTIFNSNNSGLTKLLNSDVALYVSNATQKVLIEISEEGAEAAAATGIRMKSRSAPDLFYADRPFLFLLLGANRTPFFIGAFRGSE